MLADFMSAALFEKPDDLWQFAAKHFACLGRPVRSVVVVGPLSEIPPGFEEPAQTYTRPPRASDPPGTTYATREDLLAKADRLLEYGDDDIEGELVATSLESLARVKGRGNMPLLNLPLTRAKRALLNEDTVGILVDGDDPSLLCVEKEALLPALANLLP